MPRLGQVRSRHTETGRERRFEKYKEKTKYKEHSFIRNIPK